MSFCLPKEFSDQFIAALKAGKIVPEQLIAMSSAERRAYLGEIVGEANAKPVNALLESKLLLKDQKRGMVTWAKQVSGITPQARHDLIARIEKMDRILDPADAHAFLEDLAAKRLGTDVSLTEAKTIAKLSQNATRLLENIDRNSPRGSASRMEYGRALYDLGDFVSGLKREANKMTREEVKQAPGRALGRGVVNAGGLVKSMKASLDNSAIGRQGLKVMFTQPRIWARNSLKTFDDIVKTFGGKDVAREVQAEVLSRENALNGAYKKEKLAIDSIEEAFPTSLPQRIPIAGRAFKASEAAFTSFLYRTRADVFDRYMEIAQKSGADISGIGKVANSLTGRGTFGQRGEAAASIANNLLFSPRLIKSHVDTLTAHAFDSGISPFARKQAAINTLKIVGGIAAVLAIAKAVDPDSVDYDPRSADFGKIKVGATRFDVTGGLSSLATLAARIALGSSKSSTSGKITRLNDPKAYKGPTTESIIGDFTQNKLAPLLSALLAVNRGYDKYTKKPVNLSTGEGAKNLVKTLVAPIPVTNYEELQKHPDAANILLAVIADELGFSTNTY